MRKRITKYLGGVALLSVLALFSCQKEGEMDRTERKLVGTWTYDEATVPSGMIGTENVMSEYDADQLIIKDDFTVEYYDDETQNRSYGTWVKTTETLDECVTDVLTLDLTRSSDSSSHQMVIHHVYVTKKKLKGYLDTPHGEVDVVLLRQ
ncbi:MAG: hypothetical protein ACFHU9_07390 [Fluviicola sp.]